MYIYIYIYSSTIPNPSSPLQLGDNGGVRARGGQVPPPPLGRKDFDGEGDDHRGLERSMEPLRHRLLAAQPQVCLRESR